MFERFTEETREVIRRAQQEARAMSHGAVGTEHLVLALNGVDGGIVAEVFTELGITSGVRREVRKRLGPGPDEPQADTSRSLRSRSVRWSCRCAKRWRAETRTSGPSTSCSPSAAWVRAAAARSSARWVRART